MTETASIQRIVPNILSTRMEASKAFHGQFPGLDLAMDMGWVLTFAFLRIR